MAKNTGGRLPQLLQEHEGELVSQWMEGMRKAGALRADLVSESEVKAQCSDLIKNIAQAAESGNLDDIQTPEWAAARNLLSAVSASRARQGFTPAQVAGFVFALKQPLFSLIQKEGGSDTTLVLTEAWTTSTLIDQLGLWTTEVYQKSREEVILRQQEELLELSTPVVQLWDGILALPIIGTLDSRRTQVVMESLLQAIVDTGADVAIIDITGVPTVDTLVSQHLLKTVAAARLMGAECIISGIRPQIAQTIVHLGVDLGEVITKATLADAFRIALKKAGSKLEPARA